MRPFFSSIIQPNKMWKYSKQYMRNNLLCKYFVEWEWTCFEKYLQNKIKPTLLFTNWASKSKQFAIRLLFVVCGEITGHMLDLTWLETCKHRRREECVIWIRKCVEFDFYNDFVNNFFSTFRTLCFTFLF